jgi:methionyl-tRNA formyltransferase
MVTHEYLWDTPEQQSRKQVYSFCDLPKDHLEQYQKRRQSLISRLEKDTTINTTQKIKTYSESELRELEEFQTEMVIETISDSLKKRRYLKEKELEHYKRILKKTELKKLRISYDRNFINTSKIELNTQSLAYLGIALGRHAQSKEAGYLQSLSTLLKINDYLVSKINTMESPLERAVTLESLRLEREGIDDAKEFIPSKGPEYNWQEVLNSETRTINNLGMLLQETHRSKAYLQSLIRNGLLPNYVLLLKRSNIETENLDLPPTENPDTLFDPSILEEESLKEVGIPYQTITANSFNEEEVVERIKKRPEEYFVFSGRGILKEIFSAEKKIIHVHPGKLPEYRGSTCPYYSVLSNDGWWTTSFLMTPEIDKGQVLRQREFPLPADNIDTSRVYDPLTRSQVLVETIMELKEKGKLDGQQQDLSLGIDYYTIHPTLEFIAKEAIKKANQRII